MVLINKIEDVSKCCCHGDSTHRDVLSINIDWKNNRVIVEVVDICNNCGVDFGGPLYMMLTRDD